MKQFSLFILISFFCLPLSSQQYECNCQKVNGTYNHYLQNLLIAKEYFNPIQHYRGEQYYNDWASGIIILNSGDTVTDLTLRYDRYLDELLRLRTTDFKIGVINKSNVAAFVFFTKENKKMASFVKKEIKLFGMNPLMAYLQILTEGNVSFYVYRNVVEAVSESKTVDNTKYILFVDSNRYVVTLNKRSLIKTPGIDKVAMKRIIRANHLTLHQDEADFAKAVNLYNEANR